jgi:hypothetical protein
MLGKINKPADNQQPKGLMIIMQSGFIQGLKKKDFSIRISFLKRLMPTLEDNVILYLKSMLIPGKKQL